MALSRHHLQRQSKLSKSYVLSVLYHDIFSYPLKKEEFERWKVGEKGVWSAKNKKIDYKDGFYFVKGKEELIQERKKREKYSQKKLEIAKVAANFLAKIPTVQMVGITGSLAMRNAKKESDIDLMIITTKGTMWATRLICYFFLKLFGFDVRRPKEKDEKDKLCLNIWMDESDLFIDKHDLFTAHELLQIIPLVNRNKTHERLISKNTWSSEFWPNVFRGKKTGSLKHPFWQELFFVPIEKTAYITQFFYMKKKITREHVSKTRALFHPFDWGEKTIDKLNT